MRINIKIIPESEVKPIRYQRKYVQFGDLVLDNYETLESADLSGGFKTSTEPYSFTHGSYACFKRPQQLSEAQELSLTLKFDTKKVIITSFAMPVAGGGSTSPSVVSVNGAELATDGQVISPNPHGHTTEPHEHSVSPRLSLFQSHLTDAQIIVDGVDISPYLKEQHGGAWIDGEGIFPGEGFVNYDILGIAGKLPDWQKGVILRPGYKKVEVKGNGMFNVTVVSYLKFSHINR